MANISKIQWTDATWNVAVGCSKVDKDCLYCYMYRQSLNGTRYKPDQVIQRKGVFTFPLKYKEKTSTVRDGDPLIFTSSLTDFFHEDVDSFRDEAWDIIRKCPHLTFQILTKRPDRIKAHLPVDWGDGWDNVWMGTSIGSQKGQERINELLLCPSRTRFASIEPMHGEVDLTRIMEYHCGISWTTNALSGTIREWDAHGTNGVYDRGDDLGNKLDWVIVGGESGNDNGKYKYRPCEISWIENIVSQCKKANVPVFVKQLGTHLSKEYNLKDRHAGNMDEWPDSLTHVKVREFPVLKSSESLTI